MSWKEKPILRYCVFKRFFIHNGKDWERLTTGKTVFNLNNFNMGWIKETESKPPFGELVLVYCRIYGRFLATYEYIGDFGGEQYGNWKYEDKLGILPPVYWMKIDELPE